MDAPPTISGEVPKETEASQEAKKVLEDEGDDSYQPPVPPKDLPKWPELSPEHPLSMLNLKLPQLIAEATYSEVYGLNIDPSSESSSPFSRNLILQKFLRANANDVDKAAEQLRSALEWRKQFDPLGARDAVFSQEKYGKLGYVTKLSGVPESPNSGDVVTFNIYGAVTDNKSTFGDTESFMRWRIALMELSIQSLNLDAARNPIPDYGQGPDPYQGIQVHDYVKVSFLRQDPHVKAASSEAINTFKKYYPETLSRKFFVNVPAVMGWMFGAMKMVLSAETTKKFTVVSDGSQLVKELGDRCPEEYGGKGGKLAEIGRATKVD